MIQDPPRSGAPEGRSDTRPGQRFGKILERVCRERGFELLPSGVVVPCDDGRRQVVFVELFEFRGRDLVRLHSTVGSASELSPERLVTALRVNATLPHGAVAVRDDELVVTDTLLLNDIDADELEACLGYLAETADYYERMLFGTDDY